MSSHSMNHLLLLGAHSVTSVAYVCYLVTKARQGNAASPWHAWSKLAIAGAAVVKVGSLVVDLHIVPMTALTLLLCTASTVFEAMKGPHSQIVAKFLESMNSPFSTYTLALTSALVDALATSLSLTMVSSLLQSIISTLACISMLCSVWLLVFAPDHSIATPQDNLLSVRQPLASFYQFTLSIICDTVLDTTNDDTADDDTKQPKAVEPDYLQEFHEFLFDKRNLSQPLEALLWTLWKPARIIVTLSALMAFVICMQAVLVYTALFLLENQATTPYAAFVHCTFSVAMLYYAMAALGARIRQFTTDFALKLRTTVLTLIAEKLFRLSRSAAAEANLNSFLGTELQTFIQCISTFGEGLISTFAIGGSFYGLTFVIGRWAYVALASLFVYFGLLANVPSQTIDAEHDFQEKRKKRLAETHPILRNLLSIKTLGLQSFYLTQLCQLRNKENEARGKLREQMGAATAIMFIFYPIFSFLILCGLASRHFRHATSATDIYPTLIVLAILGERIGKVNLSVFSLAQFQYLQRLMDLLNREEVPLRFEDTMEANQRTQLRICNLSSEHTSKRDTLFLKNVNIELFRGDFTFIYGRTGSGKTTFLQAILGEQMMSAGSIHVADASLAYCGQDSWLPDTSIQLCITGGNPINATRYRRVVSACRLPAEMTSLTYSASTKIGSNGRYLSRTNRAKMILARAAYAGASIVLLDDSFAAFDTAESIKLARTLLNPTDGLLREGRATVLLASHSFAVPSLIDDVYCLATCQFITYPDGENTEASESIIDSHAPTSLENPAAARATADLDSMHAHNDKHCNHHEEARRVSLQKNIAFVWKTMVKSEDWGKLVLSVFGIIILEAPIIIGTVVWPQLRLPMVPAVALHLCLSIAYSWIAMKVISRLGSVRLTFSETTHKNIATKIMTSSLNRTFHLSSTELLNLLDTDLEVLDTSPYKLFQLTYFLGSLTFSLLLLFWSTNYSLTVVCITIVFVAVVEHACSGISKRASECSDYASQKLNAKFTEVTDGLPYIRGFGWEKHMLRQLLGATQESEAAMRIALSLEPWFDMCMSLCWTLMATTLVAYSFFQHSGISPNMLGLGLAALVGLPPLATDVLAHSMGIKEFVSSLDRIRQFMVADDEPCGQQIDPTTVKEDWGSIPEIVFEDVEIGANAPLNGKIRGAGQVLVQGCNGSGKTSLLLALIGKREYKGSIRIDGVEARDLSYDAISNLVSILPQDPVAIPGTFEDNLFLTQYTDPNRELEPVDDFLTGILEKLDLVHLTEPDGEGFDSLVSQMMLSEGQIALLNLARCAIDVLGKQTRVVVIDDMFSKLDDEYADRAKDFIQNAFKACIVLVAETNSESHLQVKGLTPLDEEYQDHPDSAQRAATVEEVRQYHKARKGKNIPDEAPPPPRPNPPDPFFEPKRPAPRPPPRPPKKKTYTVKSAMAEYTRDTTAPNTRQTRRRRNTNAEDGAAADAPNVGDPASTGGEASDPNPDGSLTAREMVMINALRGIPSEHTRRRDEERRERRRKMRESNPGAFPDGEDYDEDDWMYNARPAKPGTVEYQIQQFVIRFMIGFAIVCAVVILLIIFL